uniref:Transmembrane protein n=2 Tax=Peronospora matthiolae TaxID=2874970 RepID=A0AAV1UKY1_9STRA
MTVRDHLPVTTPAHSRARLPIPLTHYPIDTASAPRSEEVIDSTDRPTDRPIKRQTNSTMKITALAITALATVASVASADDYQPALRALAAQEPTAPIADTLASDPTKQQSSSPVEAAAAAANTEHDVDDDSKKAKEWWGRPGWGHRWGGYGWGRPWGGYGGGWGGYGGGWGW